MFACCWLCCCWFCCWPGICYTPCNCLCYITHYTSAITLMTSLRYSYWVVPFQEVAHTVPVLSQWDHSSYAVVAINTCNRQRDTRQREKNYHKECSFINPFQYYRLIFVREIREILLIQILTNNTSYVLFQLFTLIQCFPICFAFTRMHRVLE